ncbi:hypothetical protein F5Y16DRAFT_419838 [Xylariaceae sp. FL0255]|nr:hypothetical protein F5Y16DRAFT_419838 [Xylariaceae sp. FL0255]
MSAKTNTRLLPSIVDELALSDPSRILYSIAKTRHPGDGFLDITAARFARAVNRCAWFIEESLGRGVHFPTILYMGWQDLNYAIVLLASIKTGYKLLLSSPRNTLEAHLYLLNETNCDVLLTPVGFQLPAIPHILASKPLRHIEVSSSEGWLAAGEADERPYPYEREFTIEAQNEPFVVLHTSGSTGLPKPVVQTHGLAAALDAFAAMEDGQSTFPAMCKGQRVYLAFPLFHCAEINMLLPGCLYGNFTVVLGPFPPSAETVNSIHVHGDVRSSLVTPTTIIDLVQTPEHLANLSRLDMIGFGGGPCPKSVGDLVITKTRLMSCLGSTECGILPRQMAEDRQDRPYIRQHRNLGYEYRHVPGTLSGGKLYELVIVRDEPHRTYQGVFASFPHLTEWPTKDLYFKHPDPAKPDYWLYHGRTDDIIVFANGEKLNPIQMEGVLNANFAVSAVLVAGHGRFQTSLLVEATNPPADRDAEEKLLESIWPSIQMANKLCPSYGCILHQMVMFTWPDKPMLRAGKGTVQRKATLDMYASELNALYDDMRNNEESSEMMLRDVHAHPEINIETIIANCTSIDTVTISADTNLFDVGMNSLHVLGIARKLTEEVISITSTKSGARPRVKPAVIYANPTLAALTDAVSNIINDDLADLKITSEYLEGLYQNYTASLPISGRPALSPSSAHGLTVLLTGSTGSLGSYILDSLQRCLQVSRIYCLCRGPGSYVRQRKTQNSRGLEPLTSKLQILEADLSLPYLGLPTRIYKELLGSVTHIIHNAWKVDFNLSIDSFASNIDSAKDFVHFSALSRFDARVFFISSISAVSGLAGDMNEEVYADRDTPEASCYGQSKFLSERILDAAVRDADIPCTICRVGQVAGPTSTAGVWPKTEWLPSLIASSRYLGKLPGSLGRLNTIDWLPVDILGDILGNIIVELALSPVSCSDGPSRIGAFVYHTVNPRTTTWDKLVPSIVQRLGGGETTAIEVIPLQTWVDELHNSTSADLEDFATVDPAAKLVNFYESLVTENMTRLKTDGAQRVSETLATVASVGPEWMVNWLRQWGYDHS